MIHLEGTIDETPPMEQAIGTIDSKKVAFGCKEIRRLNSAGVRGWIIYFENLKKRGIQFRFFECSPTIMEQVNLIRNFRSGAPVDSFYLPYLCTGCKAQFQQLVMTDELIKNKLEVPTLTCPKCKSPMNFDDLPEEYFIFISLL
ncbi:MAG: hypothetical protein AABZ55_08100 [Bdellovibrionota bacterium]